MVETPLVVLEKVVGVVGDGSEDLFALVRRALAAFAREGGARTDALGGVVAATFSNPDRFPALAVRVAAELGLPAATPAFDVQMACSAYPYALYLAGRLAADTGRKVLVVDADVQTPLVDPSDHATGHIFSDAATVTLVSCDPADARRSRFDFLSRADDALSCPAAGPIRMDGMKVFTFVATEVSRFLKDFLAAAPEPPGLFVPHQANPYMVRQLAKAVGLADRLLTLDAETLNPGSSSVPLTLATCRGQVPPAGALALVAGFGAGYSAAAGLVKVL